VIVAVRAKPLSVHLRSVCISRESIEPSIGPTADIVLAPAESKGATAIVARESDGGGPAWYSVETVIDFTVSSWQSFGVSAA
jgi:hypothetical protein